MANRGETFRVCTTTMINGHRVTMRRHELAAGTTEAAALELSAMIPGSYIDAIHHAREGVRRVS